MAKIQIHKPKIQIPKNIKKIKQSDSKVNTAKEMINASKEALWGKNPVEALKYERIERRKRMNWLARFSLSLIVLVLATISRVTGICAPAILIYASFLIPCCSSRSFRFAMCSL